jgi:diadenosine tetraphosphate (Ap4A) HIT family hydrolase
MNEGCHICKAFADSQQFVYDDGPWFAFAAGAPGWVMLGTKEHREGMWSLSADDAAGLGPAIRAVGGAVKQVTNAHRVHMVFLGETGLHFHLGFFPRAAGDRALLDNAPLIEAARGQVDTDQVRVIAERIRSAALVASESSRRALSADRTESG